MEISNYKRQFQKLFFDVNSISSEAEKREEYCTNCENMILAFDCEAQLWPCHYIYEMNLNGCNAHENLESLRITLNNDKVFSPLSDEEHLLNFSKDIDKRFCNECDYKNYCARDRLEISSNMCYLSRMRHRLSNNLSSEDTLKYCMRKDVFDMIFEYINAGEVNLDDIVS